MSGTSLGTKEGLAMATQCILCEQPAEVGGRSENITVKCRRCGTYQVTEEAVDAIDTTFKLDRYKISGLTRAASDRRQRLSLRRDMLDDLVRAAPILQTPFDAIDRLLLVLDKHTISVVGSVTLEDVDYPLVFARDFAEFREMVTLLETTGYITTKRQPGSWICRTTLKGWQHVGDLRRVGRSSGRAFVAMWFSPEMNPAWSEGIEPALSDAGYSPVRVDRVEYNNKIDDQIIAEIRQSGLVVADFTGNRGGVYLEAGFAQGLGLPVIFTVRKDHLKDVHFDTRQYNYIDWTTTAELRDRLYNRLVATLGMGPNPVPS